MIGDLIDYPRQHFNFSVGIPESMVAVFLNAGTIGDVVYAIFNTIHLLNVQFLHLFNVVLRISTSWII